MKKDKNIDDYIKISKYEIILYFILFIIISGILIFVANKYDCEFYLYIIIVPFLVVISKISIYININKIKKHLVDKKLLNKIGKIRFWNYRHYLLADNYMIIKKGKIVRSFSYDEIVEINRKVEIEKHTVNKYSYTEYLYIKLKDYSVFKILIDTMKLVNEEYKDITKFLLDKNKLIKYRENI